MAKVADEPLEKITLNLFERDVADLKHWLGGEGYQTKVRDIVRDYCRNRRAFTIGGAHGSRRAE